MIMSMLADLLASSEVDRGDLAPWYRLLCAVLEQAQRDAVNPRNLERGQDAEEVRQDAVAFLTALREAGSAA